MTTPGPESTDAVGSPESSSVRDPGVTGNAHPGRGPQAAEDLLPQVYQELRSLAKARMALERPGQTIQPTVLVHEAYLRLVGEADPGWNGRGTRRSVAVA